MHFVADHGRRQNRFSLFTDASFGPKMSFGWGKIQKLRYKRVRLLNFTTNAPLFVQPRAGSYETLPGQTHANTSLSAADNLGVDNVIDLPNIEPANWRTTVLSLHLNN